MERRYYTATTTDLRFVKLSDQADDLAEAVQNGRITPNEARAQFGADELRLKSVEDDEDENEDEDDDDDEDRSMVEGYAAVFNSDSDPIYDERDGSYFTERLAPTAFKRSLASGDNIFMFWGHDPNQPIGSTNSGSLTLSTDSNGLKFRMDASRLNSQQRKAVAAGEMRMSFGFSVPEGSAAFNHAPNGDYIRTIHDLTLFETSLVTFPAYSATSAALRSSDVKQQEARAAFTAFKTSETDSETKYESRRVGLKLRAAELMGKLIAKKL